MQITTEKELREFLSSKNVQCHDVEVLSGGSANFCWRIKTSLGSQMIIKHAEPFIRIMPDVPLPLERLEFEHLALTTVPGIMSKDDHIRLPQVYDYFSEEQVILISDGGSQDLKDTYKRDDAVNIPLLGQRVGGWLARLHTQTSKPQVLELLKDKFNSKVANSIFQYTYAGFASVLKTHGHDPTLGERINAKFGTETSTDRICLCHGDFWSPNIQLENQDLTIEDKEKQVRKLRAPALTIIDWETVRVGNGATDVAKFAADAWLLDRFHGSKGMSKAFLDAYLAERPLEQHDKIRLVVHFAVHIVFYSRMRWTDEEGTKQLVRVGKEMLEAVEAEDLENLRTGPLGQLFRG